MAAGREGLAGKLEAESMGSVIRDFEDVGKLARHWTRDNARKALEHTERGYKRLHSNVPDMERATARAYELIAALDKLIRRAMSLSEEDFQKEKVEIERFANAILDELQQIRILASRI
jgi:hypothetical protein